MIVVYSKEASRGGRLCVSPKRAIAIETLVVSSEATHSHLMGFPIILIPPTATVVGLSILSQ